MERKKTLLKKSITIIYTGIFMLVVSCDQKEESNSSILRISNSIDIQRDEVVKLDLGLVSNSPSLKSGMGKIGNIPVEAVDENHDGQANYLLASVKMKPQSNIELDISKWEDDPTFIKKTQAEISIATGGKWEGNEYLEGTGFKNVNALSVPKSHTDHSWFIRYEGPGWENEMIGYRFYLDWRNAIDIFGKKVDTLVLHKVGQDGFDSYHEEEDWGMDILKAGKSLGIGSIGRVNKEGVVEHFENTDSVTCHITQNGFLSSSIETNYYGWQTSQGNCNLKSTLSILSKDRATIHNVSFDKEVDNFCTGIVKHPEGRFFKSVTSGEWAYIATYGKQTLFDDNLGMAVFFKQKQVLKVDTTDLHNQLIVFNPAKDIQYQFLGAWEKEPNGIQTREEFEEYLNQKLSALNSPLKIAK